MKNLNSLVIAALLASASLVSAQPPAASQPPSALAPAAAPADPLPAAEQKFFTTPTPSVETVNAFLKALWGYDSTRLWRVMAIQKTPAAGVSKVVIFLTDKSPNAKISSMTFYVTPDGKHAIAEGAGVVPFAPDPFTDLQTLIHNGANGATRGAPAGAGLEIVEFADLQCPHCKEAQSTMEQIMKDFPKAHIIFQLFPLVEIHPSAFKAAAYGVCVQKQSNDAFFKYVTAVFDTQDALSPTSDDTVLKAAVTRAGLDPAAIAACAGTQATKDTITADIKLAVDAGVDQTPMLAVNGRLLPLTELPYEQVKQIILYQAEMDHVPTGAIPDTLKPAK